MSMSTGPPFPERFAQALTAWRESLGEPNVVVDESALAAASTATFATTQHVLAILRPAHREQVQKCVRIAAAQRIPLYPVSCGKNWGYGSRVPVRDRSVILDLNRMNRIVDFSE